MPFYYYSAVNQWTHLFATNWKQAFNNKRFISFYLVNLIGSYLLYMYVVRILVENRFAGGPVLRDMLQQYLTPYDFSLPIFVLTYGSIIAYVIYVLPRPVYVYYAARVFLVVFFQKCN